MTVNSINNIVYLKELNLDGASDKKSNRKKEGVGEGFRNNEISTTEVEKENLAAAHPSIEDFTEAKQVLDKVMRQMEEGGSKALSAHAGKAINPYLA